MQTRHGTDPSNFLPIFLLKDLPEVRDAVGLEDSSSQGLPLTEPPAVVCRACRHEIARQTERMSCGGPGGSASRVFANPHGLVFEIVCFSRAPGCVLVGPLSSEFSWFPAHAWRIALCSACGRHLGWRWVSGEGQAFFGLITDALDG